MWSRPMRMCISEHATPENMELKRMNARKGITGKSSDAPTYSELVPNCPRSFLIVLAVVFVVLVVVVVVLEVVLEQVKVVATLLLPVLNKLPQDHQNHYQDHENYR